MKTSGSQLNKMTISSADWVDSSGVRMYLTPTLRRFDGGVMELGLEYTDKMAIPPQQPEFVLSGYCIAECTAVVRTFFSSQTFNGDTGQPATSHTAL